MKVNEQFHGYNLGFVDSEFVKNMWWTRCRARSLANNKYLFIFGQILHGIGAAPLIALGTTLLDESVSRVSAPLYIGIFQVNL